MYYNMRSVNKICTLVMNLTFNYVEVEQNFVIRMKYQIDRV